MADALSRAPLPVAEGRVMQVSQVDGASESTLYRIQ